MFFVYKSCQLVNKNFKMYCFTQFAVKIKSFMNFISIITSKYYK